MKVLIVGSGGREHALAWKLKLAAGKGVFVCQTRKQAIKKAYQQVKKIKFKNKYFRTDIGAKAFML